MLDVFIPTGSYRLDDFIIPNHPHVFRCLDVLKGGPNLPQPTKTHQKMLGFEMMGSESMILVPPKP